MIAWLKRHITPPLIGYLILASATAYTLGEVHSFAQHGIVKNEQKIAGQEQRQHEQLIEGCERLNVLRAADNKSHFADYTFITLQVTQTAGSLHANYLALKHIGIPTKTLNRALAQSEATLKVERAQAKAKSWVPLTNCKAGVATQGVFYKIPLAIPFYVRKPPASALNAQNASQLVPKGSTL